MTRPLALDLFCCAYCGTPLVGRSDKIFCSTVCAQRSARKVPKERSCRFCSAVFKVITRGDANRQYCSLSCSRKATEKKTALWRADHPDAMKKYNGNRVTKNPSAYADEKRNQRRRIIAALGGKCVVCGVDNINWLHIDYIPTTRGKPLRHPRHAKWVLAHIEDFRLLCANHHYELTLTGRIEGTGITQ